MHNGRRQIDETLTAPLGAPENLIQALARPLRQCVQNLDQTTAETAHTAQANTATKK